MAAKSVPVSLSNVTKIFKDQKTRAEVHAVEDANFDVRPGELVTLLGPSGCGKTTTLRMIGGFELTNEGKILIGDSDVTFLPPNGRQTATVFQSYGLFPHMDVFDNVAYGLKIRKLSTREIKKRVEATLELVGLSDLAHSAGQTFRRAATARGTRAFARGGAAGATPRRAVVEPRCSPARADAGRDQAHSEISRHHGNLRHTRPN